MRVVIPRRERNNNHEDRNILREIAPLPMIPEDDDVDSEHKDYTKSSSYKLYSDPATAAANAAALLAAALPGAAPAPPMVAVPKYSYSVNHIDGTQTVRKHLVWRQAVQAVIDGMNVITPVHQNAIILQLCSGTAEAAYRAKVLEYSTTQWRDDMEAAADALGPPRLAVPAQAAQAALAAAGGNPAVPARLAMPPQPAETVQAWEARRDAARTATPAPALQADWVKNGLLAVIIAACPYKVLEKQKRFMRRKMRKPNGMTTRLWVSHLERINAQELPALPPFGNGQNFRKDEMVEIILFGIPNSWKSEMDRLDFDGFRHTIGELVDFCERMESANEMSAPAKKSASNDNNGNNGKHKKSKSTSSAHGSKGKTGKWCEYHESNTHDTKDCSVIQKLKKASGSKSEPSKNKTWQRKSKDAKTYTKKELNAIVKKETRKQTQKADAKKNAKTKRKKDSSDDDDSSYNSLNALESDMKEVDRQLAEFDFTEVEC
jgi:hypothetical protein